MRRLPALIGLLALSLSVGCTEFSLLRPANEPASQSQIDEWIVNQQYGLALDALGRLPRMPGIDQDLAQQISDTRRAAGEYEQQMLAQARQQFRDGAWADAEHTLEMGLGKLLQSQALEQELAKVRKSRAAQLAELRFQRLLAQAAWLVEDLPIQEQMVRADPDDIAAARELERTRQTAQSAAHALVQHGRQAQATRDLALAERCLALATRLADLPEGNEALAEVRAESRSNRERAVLEKQRAQRIQARADAERLTQAVQHAIDRDALLDAVEPLDRLRKLAPNQAQVLELQRTLAARRAAESAQWTERGVAQYQAGQIAEAKASWERALALDPGNKVAEENLERAERVLDKLDKLRQLDALDGAQPAVSGGRPGPQNNCC
jgi:hypothetical protein